MSQGKPGGARKKHPSCNDSGLALFLLGILKVAPKIIPDRGAPRFPQGSSPPGVPTCARQASLVVSYSEPDWVHCDRAELI